jgi:toxin ParE1/3/4
VKHVIRPAAQEDIIRQFLYYLLAGAGEAATRFLDAVEEPIDAICRMPHIGAPQLLKNPNLAGLRSWGVKGFEEILIFYVIQPDALRVVRILHGRRDLKKILQREKSDEAYR